MKSICLIVAFFGEFRNFFQLFLNSCGNNPTINWLVFSDNKASYDWPSNVKYIAISFDEFRQIIEKNLGYRTALETPYKLCDFKPTYGEVLCDWIKGYDFWGYCDCDMIFGNIRRFVTDEIMNNYDRIFSRGHLSIFRNASNVNKYYRTQRYYDFKAIAQNPQNFSFDEWNGTSRAWQLDKMRMYDALPMDDILVGYDGLYSTKRLSGLESPYNGDNLDEATKIKQWRCNI